MPGITARRSPPPTCEAPSSPRPDLPSRAIEARRNMGQPDPRYNVLGCYAAIALLARTRDPNPLLPGLPPARERQSAT
ncbi:hypothetical protein OIU77_011989 [Salix suchowensis]|uniref:Uncharacterized protein n=1 Tax=Salix suchowensis TaxID=1278906 RepID=A0ABQ9A3T3_9ROSI|nr:hypothetical protein OIU77_011989 [Salix suchowensis]